MPRNRADFYMKQGIGLALRSKRKAETLMEQALQLASGAGLHEFEFGSSGSKRTPRLRVAASRETTAAASRCSTPRLREVSASLAQLAG